MNRFGSILTKIFHWVFFILIAFLFVSSVFVTATHEKYEDGGVQEFAKVTLNNIPLTIIALILGLVLVWGLFKLFNYWTNKKNVNMQLMAGVVCFISLALAITWINITNIIPGADQALCVKYADAMNNGDFSCMERGGYLANYPHLLGIIGFLRLLFKIFGDGTYTAFRYFNAICIPVLIYSGFRVTGILSKDNKTVELFYLFLMLFCIPMYGYVLFVYGDLAGPSLGMLATWFFLETLNKKRVGWYIGLFFALVAMIALRKSMLILPVAMAIVIIVRLIGKFKAKDLITVAVVVTAVLSANTMVNYLAYPHMLPDNSSVPASACIAMGLNYDNGYAGWYNYYELTVHYENNCYTDATSEAAKAVITESYIPLFVHNPKLTIDFFFNKINSQWQSPLYQSIVSNNLLYGGQNSFVMSTYTGAAGEIFQYFMKVYQMLFYLCILIYLWVNRKKNLSIENYVGMIFTFGGFLLSLVWESKGRYILPYFLLMIPVFACGAENLTKIRIKKVAE